MVSDKNKVPPTNECETYALLKAYRIVSRSPAKSETSNKPFFRVIYDLVQINTAFNKDEWISYLADDVYDFQIIFTHRYKSTAFNAVRKGIMIMRVRYGATVVFLRSDRESSLGQAFQDLIAELGITWEPTAVDTPAQNGHSERKGGVLLTRARALGIEAKLPDYLWPWIVCTSGLITNRTPMRKHDWKTPFEGVTTHKPNLSHFKRYGCKAYPLDKSLAKKDKMAPRAHIGFLVGYQSTNIFQIWIPSQHEVIATRDVMFDETSFYKPGEVDLAQVEKEAYMHAYLDIPHTDTSHIITEIPDADDDEEEFPPASLPAQPPTPSPTAPPNPEAKGKEKESYLPSPSPSDSGGDPPDPPSSPPDLGGRAPRFYDLMNDFALDTNELRTNQRALDSSIGRNTQTVADMLDRGQNALGVPGPFNYMPGAFDDDSFHDAPEEQQQTQHIEEKKPSRPRAEGIEVDNILPNTVTRHRAKPKPFIQEGKGKKKDRKETYSVALAAAGSGEIQAYHAAFSALIPIRLYYKSLSTPPPQPKPTPTPVETRLHRDNLPPEPQNWKEMLNHPYCTGFIDASYIEIGNLKSKNTWEEVLFDHAVKAGKKPVPVR